jgi:hypothetical protein
MKTTLIGLVDDGSARSELMPRNTSTTMLLPQGESSTVDVRVFYPSGVPTLLAGHTAQLVVCYTVDPCRYVPDKVFQATFPTDPVGNLARFSLPKEAFRGIVPARYLFEVWVSRTLDAERWQVIRTSGFVLTPALIR